MATTAEWGLFEWGAAEWGSGVSAVTALSINVSDASTLGDFPIVLLALTNQRLFFVSDAPSLVENVTVRMLLTINVNEAVTLAESVTLTLPGAPLGINVNESVTLAENITITLAIRILVSVTDSLTLAESVTLVISPVFVTAFEEISLSEGVSVPLGVDAVHVITITGSLDAFSQFHTIRIIPALIQGLAHRDIQKPTGQLIRT